MSRKTRRHSAPGTRTPTRAVAAAVPRRGPSRRLILVIAVAAVVVTTLVVVFTLNRATPGGTTALQPGIQTGAPPWPPEVSQLRARLASDGLPALTSEGAAQHTHSHLDLIVDGVAVVVPADIGIDQVGGVLSPIHTHDTTGIIHVESPTVDTFTLGEFFDVWGVRFDGHCVGGACDGSGRMLTVYVNGQAVVGDPRSVVLSEAQEIVVAVGTPVQLPNPVPAAYAFPSGL